MTKSEGTSGWRAWLWAGASLAIGIVVWPLVFKSPWSWWRTVAILRPSGPGLADPDFLAFHPIDAAARGWYRKLARDMAGVGPLGYVWDDGLGIALGPRIFNNTVTYRLLGLLGDRAYLLAGYLAFTVVLAGCGGVAFGPLAGILIALALAGSPLVTRIFTVMGKPEIIWYALVPLSVMLLLDGNAAAGGLVWSALVLANLGAAATPTLIAGPGLLLDAVLCGNFLPLLAGATPGLAVTAWRMVRFLPSEVPGLLVKGQRSSSRVPPWPAWDDVFQAAMLLTALFAAASVNGRWAATAVVAISATLLFYLNRRFFYFNDMQSFEAAFLTVGFGFAASAASSLAVAALFAFAYRLLPLTGARSALEERLYYLQSPEAGWRVVLKSLWNLIRRFPSTAPQSEPRSSELQAFLAGLEPAGIGRAVRYLEECSGPPQDVGYYPSRSFQMWMGEKLAARGVENAGGELTPYFEPALGAAFLHRFNARDTSAAGMRNLCEGLGCRYVIAHTAETTAALIDGAGFELIRTLEFASMPPEERRILALPATGRLNLLRHSEPLAEPLAEPLSTSVVVPPCVWSRHRNCLTIEARAGSEYLIRYRYDPAFQARQGTHAVPVETVRPFADAGLRFMRVRAVADGPLVLRYRWLSGFFSRRR
ncbi:hypothetical protein [Azospirillum isscasi]|uniref:Uncharacterized protein n=1 Tax=Azospirillum isscasi TaxID=3053926 RepID=A0ABU0WMB2_9PROT|nr:hypothetical protein [Azospirillum isscasi]MDQ2105340.1 hypothetical protein [Azospirillum isscasi]